MNQISMKLTLRYVDGQPMAVLWRIVNDSEWFEVGVYPDVTNIYIEGDSILVCATNDGTALGTTA